VVGVALRLPVGAGNDPNGVGNVAAGVGRMPIGRVRPAPGVDVVEPGTGLIGVDVLDF
jgi:hypothetical protein